MATRRRFSTPSLIFSSFWMARRIASFSSSGGRWSGPGCGMAEEPTSAQHAPRGREARMAPRTHTQGVGSISDCRGAALSRVETPRLSVQP